MDRFDFRKHWKLKKQTLHVLLACPAFISVVDCAGADVVVTAERLLKTIMDLEDAVTTRLAVHMDTNEQPQSEGGCTVWIFVCMRVCVFVLSLGERWRGKEYNSCLCVSKRE